MSDEWKRASYNNLISPNCTWWLMYPQLSYETAVFRLSLISPLSRSCLIVICGTTKGKHAVHESPAKVSFCQRDVVSEMAGRVEHDLDRPSNMFPFYVNQFYQGSTRFFVILLSFEALAI